MTFEPNFLAIITFIVIAIISIYLFTKYKKIKITHIKYHKKNILGIIFLILSTLAAWISILNFKIPKKTNQTIKWTNIIFLLDVSKSMNTIDVRYNNQITTRLNLAKQAIKNFIQNNLNNKYWLVIFTKQASTIIPPTTDKETFLTLLNWVDYKNLTKQGTDFSVWLKQAINTIKLSQVKNWVIILISDWWDSKEDLWDLNFNLPKNIKLVVIWVWTKHGWRIYLWNDDFWDPIFQTYNWHYVITKLNEDNLKYIANKFNWKYFNLVNPSQINQIKSYINKQANYIKNHSSNYFPLTRYILIISFIFFVAYLITDLLLKK